MADESKKYEAKITISADAKGVKPGIDSATKELNKLHKVSLKQSTLQTKTDKEGRKRYTNQKKAIKEELANHKAVLKLKEQELKVARLESREQDRKDRNAKRAERERIREEKAKQTAANKEERDRKKAEADRKKEEAERKRGFMQSFGRRLGFGGGGERRKVSEVLGDAAGGAVVGLGGMGLQAITRLLSMPFQAIGQQYQAYEQYGKSLGGIAGYAGAGISKEEVDQLRKGAGKQLGFTPDEVISAISQVSRATGSNTGTSTALGLSKLTGMGTGEVANIYGTLRQAGNKDFSEGGAAYKQVTKAISLGVYTGLEKARMPEFLEGVTQLTATAAGREAGDVSSTPFARLLATLGATKVSGMQGARGVAVAKALEEGFTAPGGGEEGQAMMLSAMGFGRGASYYEAKKAMQRGTAGDPNFVKKAIQNVNRVYGGAGEESNLAIEAMLGGRLSLDQIEEVQKAMASGKSQKEIDAMIRDAGQTELDVLKEIRDLFKGGDKRNDDLLAQSRRSADIQNEQIDAGDELNESLEAMQDIFREFIQDMLPAVVDTLNAILEVMQELRPLLTTTANASSALASWFVDTYRQAGATEVGGDLPNSAGSRTGTRGVTNYRLTAEDEQRVQNLMKVPLLEAAGESPAVYMSRANAEQQIAREHLTAKGIYSSTVQNIPDLTLTEAERQQLRIENYDKMAREMGMSAMDNTGRNGGVYGSTDTRQELYNMFMFLIARGVDVGPDIRNMVENRLAAY